VSLGGRNADVWLSIVAVDEMVIVALHPWPFSRSGTSPVVVADHAILSAAFFALHHIALVGRIGIDRALPDGEEWVAFHAPTIALDELRSKERSLTTYQRELEEQMRELEEKILMLKGRIAITRGERKKTLQDRYEYYLVNYMNVRDVYERQFEPKLPEPHKRGFFATVKRLFSYGK
jgi:hypothetical protein